MVMIPRAAKLSWSIEDEVKAATWSIDWACRRCGKYGGIRMKLALGPIVAREKKPPFDDEEIRRAVHTAHNIATGGSEILAGGCTGRGEKIDTVPTIEGKLNGVVFFRPDWLLSVWMWRWGRKADKEPRMVFRELPGQSLPAVPAWPPQMPPWTVERPFSGGRGS
jgi:hypothetical protein